MIVLRQNYKEQQKEFGVKRDLTVMIGRARRNAANKMDRSIEKDISDINSIVSKNSREWRSLPHGELTEKEYYKLQKERPDIEFSIDPYSNSSGSILKHQLPINSRLSGKISVKSSASPSELYHELEHVKNSTGENGKINQLISKAASGERTSSMLSAVDCLSDKTLANKLTREKELNLIKDNEIKERALQANTILNEKGILSSIRNLWNGKVREIEESSASRKAIDDVRRRNILSSKELEREIEFQKQSNQTYKNSTKVSTKLPIRNLIQIPSHRGDFRL